MLDCYFIRIIYKLIVYAPLNYHDMEDYYPVFYNSSKWLLENDFTNNNTYSNYAYNHDNLGEIQAIDFIEIYRNIDFIENNKIFVKIVYGIIPKKLISILNYRGLELVLSGLHTIDIKDWKNNRENEKNNEESPII